MHLSPTSKLGYLSFNFRKYTLKKIAFSHFQSRRVGLKVWVLTVDN